MVIATLKFATQYSHVHEPHEFVRDCVGQAVSLVDEVCFFCTPSSPTSRPAKTGEQVPLARRQGRRLLARCADDANSSWKGFERFERAASLFYSQEDTTLHSLQL